MPIQERSGPPVGIPGGRNAPNRATKFVVMEGPFAGGYAFVGMVALAVTQLVLIEAETDAVRTDHNRALMFGRTAATPAGQPFATWPKPQQRVEAEEETQRGPNNTTLHLYRTGYQTVGQPRFLLSWKTSTLDAETYDVKTAPPDLHRYRTGYQTVGQPWGTWPKPAVADQSIEPDAQRTDQTLLHKYRTGYRTVGQPPSMWPGPQKRVEAEEYQPPKPVDLTAFRNSQPAVSIGQPWYLWKPQVRYTDAEEYLVRNVRTFASQSVTTAGPGQPWYLWPTAKSDQTVEPDAVRTDHARQIFFGRTTPAAAVPGAPWYLWKPQVRHTDPEEYTVPKPSDFALTRVTIGRQWYMYSPVVAPQYIEDDPYRVNHQQLYRYRGQYLVASPGQPWWMWPSAKADQTVEPNPVVRDHAADLYPFRPHDAIVVVPPDDGARPVPAGKSKKQRKDRYIARYKDELYEFATLADLEEFVDKARETEAEKPKKKREIISIKLDPEFADEIESLVDVPKRLKAMPIGAAMAQVRKIDYSIEKILSDARKAIDDDDEEILLWLLG